MNPKKIKIGCASAFWGDTSSAARQLVEKGDIDYLVSDFLAEMTMSILAGSKKNNPKMGYATDFIDQLSPLLATIKSKNIKVISNAGGVNLNSCKEALEEIAHSLGIALNIAIIAGDDLMSKKNELMGLNIKEMETDKELPDNLLSANAYLGAIPINEALKNNADIVITGRCVDSALVLGPLMYEFNWSSTDYDLLAAGSLAGHIIECGAQCTGGNFTDWKKVKGFENIGFPVIEVSSNGEFVVSKPENTGGLVSFGTVAEQFLYEIGDPGQYILPDVICDFRSVLIEEIDKDKVLIKGAKGFAPTKNYKVSATFFDGYRSIGFLVIGGKDAAVKAQICGEAILKKTELLMNDNNFAPFDETLITVIGSNSIYGSTPSMDMDIKEVTLRIVVTHQDKSALRIFTKEIAQAATGMTPGVINYLGGRPKISPSIKLFSFLVDKTLIDIDVITSTKIKKVNIDEGSSIFQSSPHQPDISIQGKYTKEVPLISLAYARSGDKGDHANIGIIARKKEYLNHISASLSEETVKNLFRHFCKGEVLKWHVPGINGINFLLKNSLDGGGMSSLRIDPQGKSYAQQLLEFPIKVPDSIYEEISLKNKG